MALPRLAHTLGANAVGKVIQALSAIIFVPLFLHAWGAVTYGEWLVLTSVPSYLLMTSDLGLGTVATTEMTMQVGRGERDAALVTLQSVWVLVCLGGLLFGTLATLALLAAPIDAWLNVETISLSEARAVVFLLLLAILVGQQDQLVCAGIRCNGAFAAEAMSRALTSLAQFSVVAGVLLGGGRPVIAAAGMLGTQVVAVVLKRLYLALRFPWVQWGIRHARFAAVRRLARPALAYLGLGANNALGVQGVVTAIGVVLGPVSVTMYFTTRTVFNSVKQLMSLVNASVWPELTQAYGRGKLGAARRLHRISFALAFWGGLGVVTALALGGPALYRLWVGSEVPYHAPLFYFMALAAFANILWFASGVAHFAINRHGWLALVNLAGTITVVTSAFALTRMWGVEAVAVVLAVVEAATALFVLRKSLQLLGDAFRPFVAAVAAAPLLGWRQGVRFMLDRRAATGRIF